MSLTFLLCVAAMVLGSLGDVCLAQDHTKSARQGGAQEKPLPEDLLQRSYSLGGNLSAEERCFHLFALDQAAEKIHSARSAAYVKAWSNELFQRTYDLSPSWNRAAFQKNALQVLASVDAPRAFDLLLKVDKPESSDRRKAPEDLRAFAAQVIFPKYWEARGPSTLNAIRAESREIAKWGEYPYSAMNQISKKLTERKDSESVRLVFREALGSYGSGTHVRSANQDFVLYLEGVWSELTPDLRMEGVSTVINHLESEDDSSPGKTEAVRVVTDKGTVLFSKKNIALMNRVLPKVRELDPEWAKLLEEKHPELRQPAAAGNVQHTSSMAVYSDGASSAQVSAVLSRGLQEGVLSEMRDKAKTDPSGAVDLLGSISDPQIQTKALAFLAASFRATDPKRSEDMFDLAQRQADKLPAGMEKLDALAAIAEAASSIHDSARLGDEIAAAFELSDDLLREELDANPGEPVYTSGVLAYLSSLTSLGGELAFDQTLKRLNKVRNDTLRAYLLAALAEGLQKSAVRSPT